MANRLDKQRGEIRQLDAAAREFALGRLQGEVFCSVSAVVQQAARLRENRQMGPEFMADGRAFAYFLRDAIRISETCALLADAIPLTEHGLAGTAHAIEIRAALSRVNDVCPDAADARNALEHCDEYVLNLGMRQKSHPGDYAQLYTRSGPRLEIRVGTLIIDVALAELAAKHLGSVVMTGCDDAGMLPVSQD